MGEDVFAALFVSDMIARRTLSLGGRLLTCS